MKKITLEIEGMTCSACSSGLENYLKKQEGILDASVHLVLSIATISYNEDLTVADIERYVQEAGFKSLGEFREISNSKQSTLNKKRLCIMTILVIFVFVLSMGPMWSLFEIHHPFLYGVFLFLLACFFLWDGKSILKSGFKNLIHKMPNMDSLILCSVGCSFLYSLYSLVQVGFGNTFYMSGFSFESCCMVLYFIRLGRMIETNSREQAKGAIQSLVQITPSNATLKENDKYKEVTLDEVRVGNILVSKAGQKIAVDGTVIDGKSYVDEAFITGESEPVLKEKGDAVIAGSICYDGTLEYRAEKIGKDSMISGIVKLVVESTGTKTKIQRLADKISGYFVPFILFIAIVTFAVYLFIGYPIETALSIFVTILVIACPCALGLAVPLVSVISSSLSTKRGILVKSSEVFEIAKDIDTIVFDKTGTITYGHLMIDRYQNRSKLKDQELLKIISSIEAKSNHPIASAFLKDDLFEVTDFQVLEGCGVTGKINDKEYFLGNKKLLNSLHLKDSDSFYEELVEEGCSIVYILRNDEILGLCGVKDVIREEAPMVLEQLKKQGLHTVMLTGDNATTASMIASKLAISEIISDVLPSEKAEVIQKFVKDGRKVMMVGDGINDAPALVCADIGVSIQDGSDIAIDAADVILMNNHISRILDFMTISKHSYQIIRQNIGWAFVYNMCMIPIAIGILSPFGIRMNPVMGSIAMILSSLTVVLNSLRLNKMKGVSLYV